MLGAILARRYHLRHSHAQQMDGFEVLRRLRGAERPVPVLVSPPAMPVLLKGPELR